MRRIHRNRYLLSRSRCVIHSPRLLRITLLIISRLQSYALPNLHHLLLRRLPSEGHDHHKKRYEVSYAFKNRYAPCPILHLISYFQNIYRNRRTHLHRTELPIIQVTMHQWLQYIRLRGARKSPNGTIRLSHFECANCKRPHDDMKTSHRIHHI